MYPVKSQSTKPSSQPSTSSLESINSPYISIMKSSSNESGSLKARSAFDDPNFSSAISDHHLKEKLRCMSTKSVDSTPPFFHGARSASGSVSPHQDSAAVTYLLSQQSSIPLMFKKNTFSSPKIVKAMHEVHEV